ncbi:MAG: radical SAM protein [Candidatus Omnitrophota bacterium]|nr:radical SAM protein [Candidatus Omnitrophota bacterium]
METVKSERKDIHKIILFNVNDAFPAGEIFQEPALGLGYIKSYFDMYSHLKDKINITILKKDIWQTLVIEKPDVIGISSVTQDYTNAIKYAKKIKQAGSKALIIIGGIHISNLPESFNDVFDIGVTDEGEQTFKELIESIYEFGFDKERLRTIKGLLYKEGEELVMTGRRALIDDLDSIPPPYRKYLKFNTLLHILTARGCPYKCAYCSSSAFWGYKVRFHSPKRIIDEMIELIKEYHLMHISIWDDLFAINKKRLREIVNLIKDNRAVFKDITFGVTARPNVVDEELCELLREMNVTRVSLGIESGSDKMLKVLNRNITVEQNHKAVKVLKKYKFTVNGGVIVGSPQESLDDLEKTYDFVLSSELDGGGIGLALPYPNTEFWNFAKKRNLVSADMDFSKLVLIQDPTKLKAEDDFIFLNDTLSRKDFLEIAIKIHKLFVKKNALSFFNRKNFNLRNVRMSLSNPKLFFPFIMYNFKKLIRSLCFHG